MLAKGLKIFRNHLLPKVKKTFLNLFLHTMRESTYRIVTRAEKRASQRSNQSYEMITHRAINERHWFFCKTWAVKNTICAMKDHKHFLHSIQTKMRMMYPRKTKPNILQMLVLQYEFNSLDCSNKLPICLPPLTIQKTFKPNQFSWIRKIIQ